MFRIALKGILGRKARLVLTAIAVILGTSFLSGTYIFSDTLNRTFNNLFEDVFKNIDAFVRSSQVIDAGFGGEERERIPVSLVDTVKKVPGVDDAEGNIQAFARIIGKDGKPLGSEGFGPPTFGASISTFSGETWRIKDGRLPANGEEVALDEASFKDGKFSVGDTVKVVAAAGSREFTLVGVAGYGDVRSPGGSTFALFDIATASEFLAKPGYVDAILVTGDGSVGEAELAARIAAALPATAKTETLTGAEITKETQDQIGQALSFFSILLSVFSYIALGVGAFVIYNVFSISAAQRQRENALLRALGASKRQVTTTMLIEAVFVGIFGSAIGLFAGLGLSRGLTSVLNAAGIDVPSTALVFATRTIAVVLLVGSLVTLVSAILPARRAGRVPPLAAMRDTMLDTAGSLKKRVSIGAAFAIAGGAVLVGVIAGADNALLGVAILLVFVGVLVLGPAVARPVSLFIGRPAARFTGITGSMARQNAARNPKRTSRTAAPVLIGVALVTAVTALAASIRTEISDVFGKQFTGDFAITSDSPGFGGFAPTLADDVNTLPEVQQATGIGIAVAKAQNKGQYLTVINPDTITGIFDLETVEGSVTDLDRNSILISEKYATNKGLSLGSVIDIELTDGTSHPLSVVGIYRRDELAGRFTVSRDLFENSTVSRFDFAVYVLKKGDVSSEKLRTSLESVAKNYGTGKVQSKQEFIDERAGRVNQLLGLIYGLLALSIIIATVGIIITLLLSIYERRRELGLLRAVGMTRGQVRVTVLWESIITSLLGAVMGIVLGLGLGWVIVFALRDQGINTFSVPVTGTVAIIILSFFIGVLAAAYPARRATRVDILDALTTT